MAWLCWMVPLFFFSQCNATGGNCFYKTYSSGMDAILEWYRFHYMNIMSQLPVIINISDHEEQIEDMVYSCQYDGEPCRPRYVASWGADCDFSKTQGLETEPVGWGIASRGKLPDSALGRDLTQRKSRLSWSKHRARNLETGVAPWVASMIGSECIRLSKKPKGNSAGTETSLVQGCADCIGW